MKNTAVLGQLSLFDLPSTARSSPLRAVSKVNPDIFKNVHGGYVVGVPKNISNYLSEDERREVRSYVEELEQRSLVERFLGDEPIKIAN